MNVREIQFPADGYGTARIVYAFLFADRSVYVGITGTSNNTGTSPPFERLATHLRKSGNTFSILHSSALANLRNMPFAFCFTDLPPDLAPAARQIEESVCDALRRKSIVVRNGPPTGTLAQRDSKALAYAQEFSEQVAQRLPQE